MGTCTQMSRKIRWNDLQTDADKTFQTSFTVAVH